MIKTAGFQNGTVIEMDGKAYQVMWYQHHKMAGADAVMRVKLKDLRGGSTIERTFKSGQSFREIPLERKKKQFLYSEGDQFHFMDMVTFDQIQVTKDRIGNIDKYLTENLDVTAIYLDDEFLSIEMPASVVLKVVETVPGVKGDSVSNLTKPATMETGVEVKVPLFVDEGDTIKVDTRTGTYVERV